MRDMMNTVLVWSSFLAFGLFLALAVEAQEGPPEDAHLCENTCPSSNDGECDDGGEGSIFALCALGTDCADCGPRTNP